MNKIQVMFPEIPDAKTKEEVRKALIDLIAQLNAVLLEIEMRLAALEGP